MNVVVDANTGRVVEMFDGPDPCQLLGVDCPRKHGTTATVRLPNSGPPSPTICSRLMPASSDPVRTAIASRYGAILQCRYWRVTQQDSVWLIATAGTASHAAVIGFCPDRRCLERHPDPLQVWAFVPVPFRGKATIIGPAGRWGSDGRMRFLPANVVTDDPAGHHFCLNLQKRVIGACPDGYKPV